MSVRIPPVSYWECDLDRMDAVQVTLIGKLVVSKKARIFDVFGSEKVEILIFIELTSCLIYFAYSLAVSQLTP